MQSSPASRRFLCLRSKYSPLHRAVKYSQCRRMFHIKVVDLNDNCEIRTNFSYDEQFLKNFMKFNFVFM
jgi:hypothetical protein